MATRIFFSLKSMLNVHYLYQFSLQHFMDMIFEVLKSNRLVDIPTSHPMRLKYVTGLLYSYANQTIGQGLRQEDQILFTLRLAQIKLEEEDQECKRLFEQFLKPFTVMEPRILPLSLLGGRISKTQIGALEELEATGQFANLKTSLLDDEEKWI